MPPHVKPESPHPAHPLHRSYKSISEMLTDDLRQTILSGRSRGGGVPPPTQPRSALWRERSGGPRGACDILEAEGLVETEPRKGARVSRLSAAEVKELWELRIQLEKLLTHHAVPAFQAEDLARTKELIQAMSRSAIRWPGCR